MRTTVADARSPGFGPDALDPVLDQCARETGAYASALYVLSPDGQVLQLAVLSGISERIAAPWARVPFLPLLISGRPIGSLVLAFDRPRAFPSAERSILIATAALIAQALDRAGLYDAEQQLAHDLQAGAALHSRSRCGRPLPSCRLRHGDRGRLLRPPPPRQGRGCRGHR